VLAPAAGLGAGHVVGEEVPGGAVGRVILAHGAPGAVGDVGAPAFPVALLLAMLEEPLVLAGGGEALGGGGGAGGSGGLAHGDSAGSVQRGGWVGRVLGKSASVRYTPQGPKMRSRLCQGWSEGGRSAGRTLPSCLRRLRRCDHAISSLITFD